jgi:hypothetical protein
MADTLKKAKEKHKRFITQETGNSISEADKRRIRNASREQTRRPPESAYKEMLMEETGNSISNADKARLKALMGEVKRYENGGCVMKGRGGSFKGIS